MYIWNSLILRLFCWRAGCRRDQEHRLRANSSQLSRTMISIRSSSTSGSWPRMYSKPAHTHTHTHTTSGVTVTKIDNTEKLSWGHGSKPSYTHNSQCLLLHNKMYFLNGSFNRSKWILFKNMSYERVHNARHKNVTSALNTTFFKTSGL